MDASRALLNAMSWFMGRHIQGLDFAGCDAALGLGKAEGVVLFSVGMTSVSLNRLGRRVP